MTVSSEIAKEVLVTDGVRTTFPFPFKVLAASEVEAVHIDAAGVTTTLDPGSFTVAGVGTDAGTLTYPSNPSRPILPAGILVIRRRPAFTQPVDIRNQEAWHPDQHETIYDRAVMRDQALREAVERTLQLRDDWESGPVVLDPPVPGALPVATSAHRVIWVTPEDLGIDGSSDIPSATDIPATTPSGFAGDTVQELLSEAAARIVSVETVAADALPESEKGAANGLATLDGSSKLPLAQLPAHGHTTAEVSGLDTALAGKQDTATLTETVQDIVGAMVVAGTNTSVVYNDGAGTLAINATGGGGGGVSVTSTEVPKVPARTAVIGTSVDAARADHVHPLPPGLIYHVAEQSPTGDGVADDTAKLTAAMNAAAALGMRAIRLEDGKSYRVDALPAARHDILLIGRGARLTGFARANVYDEQVGDLVQSSVDVFVAPNGNDTWHGRAIDRPRATFAAAANLALGKPDWKIGILPGTYTSQLAFPADQSYRYGTVADPLKSLFGRARIRPASDLGSQTWTEHATGVWKTAFAALPPTWWAPYTRVTNLYVDGRHLANMATSAAGVGGDFFYHDTAAGTLYVPSPGRPSSVLVAVDNPTPAGLEKRNGSILEDLDFELPRTHCVDWRDVVDLTIRRCGFKNAYGIAIYCHADRAGPAAGTLDGLTITDCQIDGSGWSGIHVVGIASLAGYAFGTSAKPIRVERNTCLNTVRRREADAVLPELFTPKTNAAIKFYGGRAAADMHVLCRFNDIREVGVVGVAQPPDNGAVGIWFDTLAGPATAGTARCDHNQIRLANGQGVFLETCDVRAGTLTCDRNLIGDALREFTPTIYNGGITVGRGTRGALIRHNTVRSKGFALSLQGQDGNDFTGFPQLISHITVQDNVLIPTNGGAVVQHRPANATPAIAYDHNDYWLNGNTVTVQYSAAANGFASTVNYNDLASARAGGFPDAAGSGSIESDPLIGDLPWDPTPGAGSPVLGAGNGGTNIGVI